MALNFLHCTTFPEDNCFNNGRDRSDRCGPCCSPESVHKDILDILPSDPFGMGISTTLPAITAWLEDLEVGYGGYGDDQVTSSDGNCPLFTGFNLFFNKAMSFQANMRIDCSLNSAASGFSHGCLELGPAFASAHGVSGFGDELVVNEGVDVVERSGEFQECSNCDGDEGAPHAAFEFVLCYLGVRDLLVVETVCRSLQSSVRNDPLLWKSIHIDQPLNEKVTDEILLRLTNRAQGKLQCLNLIECRQITDNGLKQVLESNPWLSKLSVPACSRLSIDGTVANLRAFKAMGGQGVKHLRIGGIYGVTQKHFEELKFLLGADGHIQQDGHRPKFFHRRDLYMSCEDNRNIDIEMCPRCQNLRLIYDCPADSCQQKEHLSEVCRGCFLCIARCSQCGCCINDSEYVETFLLELLCLNCWKQFMKYQEKQEIKITPSKSLSCHDVSCRMRLHS